MPDTIEKQHIARARLLCRTNGLTGAIRGTAVSLLLSANGIKVDDDDNEIIEGIASLIKPETLIIGLLTEICSRMSVKK